MKAQYPKGVVASLLFILVLFGLPFMGLAQTGPVTPPKTTDNLPNLMECTPQTGETNTLYVNGVGNFTPAQAFESADAIQTLLKEGNVPGRVEAFWNPGDGEIKGAPAGDMLEAIAYKYWNVFGRDFYEGARNDTLSTAISAVADWVTLGAITRQRIEIDILKSRIQSNISNGRKTVIIAHSQGNILVDTALRELSNVGVPQESIGVVHLASPDAESAATNNYSVTLSGDRLIGLVPRTSGYIFMQVEGSRRTFLGHEVVENYLSTDVKNASGETIRDRILAKYKEVRQKAENCGKPPAVTLPPNQTPTGFEDPTINIQLQGKVVDLSKEISSSGIAWGQAGCSENTWFNETTRQNVTYSECRRPWAALVKATCVGSGCANVILIATKVDCRNQEGPETGFPGAINLNAPDYTQISQAYYQQWVITGGTPPPNYEPRFKSYTLTCDIELNVQYFNGQLGQNGQKIVPFGRYTVSGGF